MKLNIQLFASGSFEFTGGSSWKTITGKIEWSESNSSIEGNTSVVTTKLYAKTGTGGTTGKSWSGNVNVGGSNHTFSSLSSSTTIGSSYVLLKTYTDTITHNTDGTKTLTISGSVSGPSGTSLSGVTASGSRSVTLDTIPRASQPSVSSSSVNLGSSVTLYTNRVSTSFTHTFTYSFGSASGTIATGINNDTTWTPPLSLASQIPSATSGTCVITCTTYNGSTIIGSKTVNLTLVVPNSVVPLVSFSSVSEAGDVPSSWGIYVKTKSRVALSLSASGIYGSSISSYKISYYGGSITTSSGTTSYLTTAGNTTFTGQVKDTRGRTKSATTTINVVDYYNPTISTAQVQRCDENGNIDNNGEYMHISYGASISSCSNKNTPSAVYKVGYRVHNTGSYTYVNLTTNANSYSASGMLFSDGIKAASATGTKVQFSTSNTYDIQFYVKDYFMEYTNVQSLDTGFDLMNFNASGKAMAIGKVSEASSNQELFEVGMNTEIVGKLSVSEYISGKLEGGFRDGNSSVGEHNANDITSNFLGYYNSNGPATSIGATTTDGALYSQAYNTNWAGQIAQDYRTGHLFTRGKNNGTWTNWQPVAYVTKVVFNGEWQVALNASGAGWTLAIPFNNPYRKTPTLTSASGQFYSGSWQNIDSISIRHFTETSVFLYMQGFSGVTANNCLVRLYGTITI